MVNPVGNRNEKGGWRTQKRRTSFSFQREKRAAPTMALPHPAKACLRSPGNEGLPALIAMSG
ncbi:hypothetical protein CXU10_07020 [Akkermansia muciniphila]|nr:hypothetical protein CXU10_07020 [Akkermansia muciniphila]